MLGLMTIRGILGVGGRYPEVLVDSRAGRSLSQLCRAPVLSNLVLEPFLRFVRLGRTVTLYHQLGNSGREFDVCAGFVSMLCDSHLDL